MTKSTQNQQVHEETQEQVTQHTTEDLDAAGRSATPPTVVSSPCEKRSIGCDEDSAESADLSRKKEQGQLLPDETNDTFGWQVAQGSARKLGTRR